MGGSVGMRPGAESFLEHPHKATASAHAATATIRAQVRRCMVELLQPPKAAMNEATTVDDSGGSHAMPETRSAACDATSSRSPAVCFTGMKPGTAWRAD